MESFMEWINVLFGLVSILFLFMAIHERTKGRTLEAINSMAWAIFCLLSSKL